ncbi:MAG: tetratricopeptide repeat protein [Chitinispirillaceae bacterium]|nr:tetratricopeptide repeat protein [Chitinispirillaceae bacterium]
MKTRWGLSVLVVLLLAGTRIQAQSIEELMAKGQQLLQRGAFSEAVSAFRGVVSREPDNFEAQFNLAFAYLQWGRNSNAIQEFKRALSYQPRNSEIWSNLAICYENLGRSDEAIGALYKAVQYNPGNITARINLAAMYHNANHYQKAIAQYKQVISIDGSNEEALTNLAKCLSSTGKYAEAKNYLMQAIASNPNNGVARWEIGNIYVNKEKNLDKAIKEFKLAITADPSQPAFYESLASAYESQGKKDDAIETLKNSLVYVDDALQKEKIQDRIDRLELGDAPKGQESTATKMSTKSQIADLQKELRKKETTDTKQIDTKPVDVMGDFNDLNSNEEEENPLDLKAAAKKKAESKK